MYFKLEDNKFTYKVGSKTKLYAQPHIHTQTELIMLYEGETYAYTDGCGHLLRGGDMFVAFPGQVHHYKKCVGAYDLILLSPETCPEFLQYFNGYLPKQPVIRGAIGNDTIMTAIRKLTEGRTDEFSAGEMHGYMIILMSEVLRLTGLCENRGYENSIMRDIVIYCNDNYTEDISLESVARALHVSRYHVSHVFSRLGVGFCEYINTLRITKACELLKKSQLSVSQIAYDVGYGSIRTFNRAFLKITGKTPRQYREKT